MVVPSIDQTLIVLSTVYCVDDVLTIENVRFVVLHIFPAVVLTSAWPLCIRTAMLEKVLCEKMNIFTNSVIVVVPNKALLCFSQSYTTYFRKEGVALLHQPHFT